MFAFVTRRLIVILILVCALLTLALPKIEPARAAANPSLASIMPAFTGGYAELRTSDIPGTLNLFTGLARKMGYPLNNDIVFLAGNQFLSQLLGRPATLNRDLLSWL